MKKNISFAILAACSVFYLAGCDDDRDQTDLNKEVQNTARDAGQTNLETDSADYAQEGTDGLNLSEMKKSHPTDD